MMKIEMFEKVGEIEIVSLRPACENKMIAEAEWKRLVEEKRRKEEEERIRKEKERIREEEEERKNAILAKEIIVKLAKAINAKAERGSTWLDLEWNDNKKYDCDNYTDISWYDFINTFKYTRPMLESAGYEVKDVYQYSTSWRRRSGKIGHVSISW